MLDENKARPVFKPTETDERNDDHDNIYNGDDGVNINPPINPLDEPHHVLWREPDKSSSCHDTPDAHQLLTDIHPFGT